MFPLALPVIRASLVGKINTCSITIKKFAWLRYLPKSMPEKSQLPNLNDQIENPTSICHGERSVGVVEQSGGKAISSPAWGLLRRCAPRNDNVWRVAIIVSEAISSLAPGLLRCCAPRNDTGSDIASKAWGICPLPSAVRCLRSTVGDCFAAGACCERSATGSSQWQQGR